MRPFLRGPRVGLHPTEASAPAGPRAWLPAGPLVPLLDEILMEARPLREDEGASAPFALVGLSPIDWTAHAARLCAGPPAAAGRLDAALLGEALRLVLRYAAEELALEAIEALPRDEEALALLLEMGSTPPAPDGTVLFRPQAFVPR